MPNQEAIAVCAQARAFMDDYSGFCADCHRVIYFRPYTAPIRVKVCLDCAALRCAADPEPPQLLIPAATVQELALYFGSMKGGTH